MKIDIDLTCLHLWGIYNTWPEPMKEQLRMRFKEELYHGAKLMQKRDRDNAAENVMTLSSLEATFLKRRGHVVLRQALNFTETTEQTMRAMSGAFVVEEGRIEEDPNEKGGLRAVLKKDDGDTTFCIYAKVPDPSLKAGQIRWVAEPFGMEPESFKTMALSEMPTADQARVDPIRPASAFPKYLRKRRCLIEAVNVRNDGRTGWLEYVLKEAEPYEADENFLKDLAKELGISEDEEQEEEQDAHEGTPGEAVDTSKMDLSEIGGVAVA